MSKEIEKMANTSLMVVGYAGAVLNLLKASVPEYVPGDEFASIAHIVLAITGLVVGEWGRRSLKNN